MAYVRVPLLASACIFAEFHRGLGFDPQRKCLRRADFADAASAAQQIEGFMLNYNLHLAHPFEWKKGVRFYKRLKDKIAARSELPLAG